MRLIRKIIWKIWRYGCGPLGLCAICFILWIGFSLVYNEIETYAPFGWGNKFDDCQLALQRNQNRYQYPDSVTEIDDHYFLAWARFGSDEGYTAWLCDRQEQRQSWSFTARHLVASSGNLIAVPYYNSFCSIRIIRLDDAKRETSLSINGCNGDIEHLAWSGDFLAVVGNRNSFGRVNDLVIEVWDVPERKLVQSIRVGDASWENMTFEGGIITIDNKQFVIEIDD